MKSWYRRSSLIAACLLCFCAPAGADGIDDPIPSFYQEPGISRTRQYTDQHANERIDLFTGKLQWHFVDLYVPGNGGLDIKVQRSYTSMNDALQEATPAGQGWTMHFGRVLRTATVGICDTATGPTANPVLELPDGSRRVMYVHLSGTFFVSTDFWKAECSPTFNGLTVSSPDGTRYEMTFQGVPVGSPAKAQNTYYVSKITDRNGNWLNLSYVLATSGGAGVTQVSSSDGRSVNFTYVSMNGLDTVLSKVEDVVDGVTRTWNYVQVPAPNTYGATSLVRVERPDGTAWQFDYNDEGENPGSAGLYSLQRVTYPSGGTIAYTYGFVQFALNPSIPRSTVVTSKTASTGGTWNWVYTPATTQLTPDANGGFTVQIPPVSETEAAKLDRTQVTGPDENKTYYHLGYTSAYSGVVYLIGSVLGTASALEVTSTGYTAMQISNQGNVRPGGTLVADGTTSAALVRRQQTSRNGESYATTFSNFDGYGNPRTVMESGSNSRTTQLTYFVDDTRWIIRGLRKDETVTEGAETLPILRSFDPNGNMLTESRAGVTTTFTYTPEGDIASKTDARNNSTAFSNYYRGVPRTENQPESVTVTRTVSAAGNVLTQTDGELATTTYTYDRLNRLTGIAHPVGNPVAVVWTSTTRKVTRGAYEQLTSYDGFGREVSVAHTDTARQKTITQTFRVDSLGRRVFASYPNSSLGTAYSFDLLNRPTLVKHEYNPTTGAHKDLRTYEHYSYTTSQTNERNLTYFYRYRAYGQPEQRELMAIGDPLSNFENTTLTRNIAGDVTSVTQDGVTRTYGYDTRFFLTSVTESETGVTTIGRDEIGNMTSRQVGTSAQTAFVYDPRNRLTNVNYPAGTPSVVRTYYKDDKLKSVDNGLARRDYEYDGNKNLRRETLAVTSPLSGPRSFAVQYGHDANDALSTITYGSGRVVDYLPDAFGWPTQVGAYVKEITYHPTGQPSAFTYGNGVRTVIGVNARIWPNTMSVGNGTLFASTYGYDGGGNVTSISDTVDTAYSRTMTYDELDRLATSVGPWGEGRISYDRRGNITNQSLGAFNLGYTYDSASQRLASVAGSKTYALSYDAYGNVSGNGTMTFGYNDASNMYCAKCGQADQIGFDYDGAGQRVRTQKPGSEVFFVYGHGGQLLWEEAPTRSRKEYIYFNGKAVATREQPLN